MEDSTTIRKSYFVLDKILLSLFSWKTYIIRDALSCHLNVKTTKKLLCLKNERRQAQYLAEYISVSRLLS